jgi:acetylornithine deacetylase/succinyl-diaminopimelate desuccinylase-like protein
MVKVIIIGQKCRTTFDCRFPKSQTAEAEIKLVQVFLGERIP